MQVELSESNENALKDYIRKMKVVFPTFNSSTTSLANMFIAEGVAKGNADADELTKGKKTGKIKKVIT